MTIKELSSRKRLHHNELTGAAAIIAVAAMIAVLFAGSTLLTPLYILYQHQFGFSHITLTLIYAVYVVGNLAALLLFGGVSDRAGRSRTAIAAIAVAIISGLIFLFAQDIAALYIARILGGFAVGVGAGTGTAWLAELIAAEDKSRAAIIATSANFIGLGIGPLASGLLAEYGPWPMQLSFVVYLAALLVIGTFVWSTRETVSQPVRGLRTISVRPRLSVPQEIRTQFLAPALAGFGAMALVGFYAALMPSLLAKELHETNHAVAGLLFFALAFVAAAVILATQSLPSRAAMLWALGLTIPSVGLVLAAQILGSMAVMVLATAGCGIATALGYRGSLQVANQIAPADRRAEVVSSYLVCCFSGNALPVIGVGVVSTVTNPTIASVSFAVTIMLFAVAALYFGVRYKE
jgi:MFS family permease